ncbi:methyltransferase domain-containing protein [Rhizobiaceae bacterium n13]|uniref:Methyltransferase domain-containing protein n=1 Tax=Ferirhizobium litorale TaxID=2927786 RepID=A0AAE3QG10_9HYPH|nr:methyltransferase domain-containing protein [Fererhizobium litorale]MDI7862283.1 methyltransferase domain-containing protein [Fererhizobium litorale]MDI7922443.1 methyltransferase domain-containing protein [Fererhizobium litorale]
MPQNQLSSGDVLTDRRADYARMLAESGDPGAAAELMEQALEQAPNWVSGWFRLGEYREKAGNRDGAIEAYRKVLGFGGDDIFGAHLKLVLLGAEAVPDEPARHYVERLFDDYAERFDKALVERLEYSVPKQVASLLEREAPDCRFACTVDLGCGTGLFGVEIRSRTMRLEGFDLSTRMLAKAAQKQVYEHLGRADLSLPTEASGLFGETLARHRADLVGATDVLNYLGNLSGVFTLVEALLADGGLFAFSVEDAGGGDGFHLGEAMRFAHSESYVRSLCAGHRLQVAATERAVLRKDGGNAVQGILFLAAKGS